MKAFTVSRKFHIQRNPKTKQIIKSGTSRKRPAGKLQRVSKLMALAIEFEHMIRNGQASDLAQLARECRVTRARMTQIMNLTLLAPDIQEQLLYLPQTVKGRDEITVRVLQKIALEPDWQKQRKLIENLI
ncbi:MAG: hypothetical protein ACIAQZ_14830 [Sedimentisphaeraceae bacterium JB056]